MAERCPFCERVQHGEELVATSPLAVAFADAFPSSPGHTLVVPRRHEPDFFALTHDERAEMMSLASDLHPLLRAQYRFDGMNIGVNVGRAAGQTVDHAHLHLIPRYRGDNPDPRGGIRHVLPRHARYWESSP